MMNIRVFFHSTIFSTSLLFLASLASLTLNILYGKVNFLFYLFSFGLFISPVSLLAGIRKISFSSMFHAKRSEYKLSQFIQLSTAMFIFSILPLGNSIINNLYSAIFFVTLFSLVFSIKNNHKESLFPSFYKSINRS